MKKFDTVLRGYDKQQVQAFLDDVIKNYEMLLEKSKKTEDRSSLPCSVQGYRGHPCHIRWLRCGAPGPGPSSDRYRKEELPNGSWDPAVSLPC